MHTGRMKAVVKLGTEVSGDLEASAQSHNCRALKRLAGHHSSGCPDCPDAPKQTYCLLWHFKNPGRVTGSSIDL